MARGSALRRRAAARAAPQRRPGEWIDTVYTSDLGRAIETAELAFGDSGIPIRRDARLRECNYGSLNGGPVSEVDRDRIKRIDEPFSGGESYQQTVERMRSFLGDVALEHGSGRIVVIGHSATRWALDHLLKGVPLEELVGAPFEWQEGWLYELTGDAESTASRSVET